LDSTRCNQNGSRRFPFVSHWHYTGNLIDFVSVIFVFIGPCFRFEVKVINGIDYHIFFNESSFSLREERL